MATMLDGNVPQPVMHDNWGGAGAGTYRGIGSSWFNAENIAAEDFMRDQQAQQLSFERDMMQQKDAQNFTASENALSRDWQALENEKSFERDKWKMQNAYQSAVEDMKKAGINPILAYSQGGAQTHGSVAGGASSSSVTNTPYRGSGYRSSIKNDPINGIVAAAASIIGKYMSGKMGLQSGMLRDSAYLDKQLSNDLRLLDYKEAQIARKRFHVGF